MRQFSILRRKNICWWKVIFIIVNQLLRLLRLLLLLLLRGSLFLLLCIWIRCDIVHSWTDIAQLQVKNWYNTLVSRYTTQIIQYHHAHTHTHAGRHPDRCIHPCSIYHPLYILLWPTPHPPSHTPVTRRAHTNTYVHSLVILQKITHTKTIIPI